MSREGAEGASADSEGGSEYARPRTATPALLCQAEPPEHPHGARIEAAGLEREYPMGDEPVRALRGLDLEVPGGQFLLVRGRSGSGKTTLLNVLAGLIRPTSGVLRVGGTLYNDLKNADIDRYRRRNIGIVFQFFNLVSSLPIEVNVALPLLLDGYRLPRVRSRVAAALEEVGVECEMRHGPEQLSGGEMQRVALARALIINPRLILADEPTGNLDSTQAHAIFTLLRDRTRVRGITTIVMTHDIDATSYADRVVEMSDGVVVEDTGYLPPPADL